MTVSQKDKEIIRELAKRYMELALSDEQKAKFQPDFIDEIRKFYA